MSQKRSLILIIIITVALGSAFSIAPKTTPGNTQTVKDSVKRTDPGTLNQDAGTQVQENISNTQNPQQNTLQIDTAVNKTPPPTQTIEPVDTVKKIDSTQISAASENTMTNTRLFIYILLSILGLLLFFYIFVITLFKTFHKKKSTRQSLLLSWNLFFIVTIIWIFIIWGLVAGFWTTASFMIVVIFLFIISLIMTIIAVKSK